MRRLLVGLLAVGVLSAGAVASASAASRKSVRPAITPINTELGYGTFGSNAFSFNVSTTSNGSSSGASGYISVFDSAARSYYDASVACVYVNPSNGQATIWGTLTNVNATGAPWKSVVLNVKPGNGSAAGFGNYLEESSAPSTCGPITAPGSPPITAGQIIWNGSSMASIERPAFSTSFASEKSARPAIITTSPTALGYGTFGPNAFSFNVSTTSNGSGGSGWISVFDAAARSYFYASTACVYVNPGTGQATIWGNITNTNATGATPWRSVVLNVKPGDGSAAGFGNFLETSSAPSTCGAVTSPGSAPITAGQIITSPAPPIV
jgi:hypothetical protein